MAMSLNNYIIDHLKLKPASPYPIQRNKSKLNLTPFHFFGERVLKNTTLSLVPPDAFFTQPWNFLKIVQFIFKTKSFPDCFYSPAFI